MSDVVTLGESIDQYCERLGPAFWAEPLNAWTNLTYVLVGLWLWRRAGRDLPARLFAGMVVVIGFGSGLFHTFATRWAMVADVAPIGIALIYLLWVYQRRVLQLAPARAWLGLAAFGAVTAAFGVGIPAAWLNGSQTYVPCLLLLMLLVGLAEAGRPRQVMSAAAMVFAVALACRSLDMALCATWPQGTHFLWHILTAVTLGLVGSRISPKKIGDTRLNPN